MTFQFLVLPLLVLSVIVIGYSIRRIAALKRDREKVQELLRNVLESQERERKWIAEELHGGLGQNLLILKNRAELGLKNADDSPAMKEQLQEISKVCSVAIDEARRTAHRLGPRHLEQLGLTEALDAMLDQVSASTGINFERKLESVDDVLPKESATSFYRIVQEALNNLMKHACASCARVHLLRDLRHIRLEIQDDGRGFEPGASNGPHQQRGLGLAVIAERVRNLHGQMEILSQPGKGTLLAITIPIQDN